MEVFKYWLNDYDNGSVKELELVRKFKTHNVMIERVDLYKDFTINLLHYIYDTYLGKQYINKDSDIAGHFNWAFKRVVDEFNDEGINFYGSEELYDYFYSYYYDQFYKADKIDTLLKYEKFWLDIFNVNKDEKDRKIFDVLIEIYDLFDKSLTKNFRNQEVFA